MASTSPVGLISVMHVFVLTLFFWPQVALPFALLCCRSHFICLHLLLHACFCVDTFTNAAGETSEASVEPASQRVRTIRLVNRREGRHSDCVITATCLVWCRSQTQRWASIVTNLRRRRRKKQNGYARDDDVLTVHLRWAFAGTGHAIL